MSWKKPREAKMPTDTDLQVRYSKGQRAVRLVIPADSKGCFPRPHQSWRCADFPRGALLTLTAPWEAIDPREVVAWRVKP